MSKAESAKQRSEAQRIDLAFQKIKEDSANDSTTPDEVLNDEKKQSTATQTCCLQWFLCFLSLNILYLITKDII